MQGGFRQPRPPDGRSARAARAVNSPAVPSRRTAPLPPLGTPTAYCCCCRRRWTLADSVPLPGWPGPAWTVIGDDCGSEPRKVAAARPLHGDWCGVRIGRFLACPAHARSGAGAGFCATRGRTLSRALPLARMPASSALPMVAARARRTCPTTGRSTRSMSCRITRVRATVGVCSVRCSRHSPPPAVEARWSWRRIRRVSSTRPWAALSSGYARSRSKTSFSASARMAGPTSLATLKWAGGAPTTATGREQENSATTARSNGARTSARQAA